MSPKHTVLSTIHFYFIISLKIIHLLDRTMEMQFFLFQPKMHSIYIYIYIIFNDICITITPTIQRNLSVISKQSNTTIYLIY